MVVEGVHAGEGAPNLGPGYRHDDLFAVGGRKLAGEGEDLLVVLGGALVRPSDEELVGADHSPETRNADNPPRFNRSGGGTLYTPHRHANATASSYSVWVIPDAAWKCPCFPLDA